MLGRYIPLLVAVCVSALIATAMVVGSLLLGPKKPTRFKESTYECGMTPVGSARDRFPVRFFLVAMLFIVFDVETMRRPSQRYPFLEIVNDSAGTPHGRLLVWHGPTQPPQVWHDEEPPQQRRQSRVQ